MIKEFFSSFLRYFVNINTAVLITLAVYLAFTGKQTDSSILWEILFSGLITALPSAALVCLDIKSGKVQFLLWLLHFLLIFGIALLMLHLFGLCAVTMKSVFNTFLAVVFIYLFTSYLHYLMDKSHVALMNEKLRKRYFK
jgi:hypothetical protein